ncbi:hypothetical protein BGZ73_003021 [Actinomortierella ambigua]|nr:hypothetical protein BGZ73_003021 [Actinomortierella ambigua]
MRFTFLTCAATLMASCAVYAQGPTAAYPTVPNAATKWKAGTTAKAVWRLTDPKNQTPMVIRLYHGEPTHLTEDGIIGTGKPGATSAEVKLEPTLPSDWYAIRVGEDDSYSHYFLIQGTGPLPVGPPPGSNTTASVTATTALATTTLPVTTTTALATTTAATPTITKPSTAPPSSAAALKIGSLAMGAVAVVAAALAF